MTDTTPQDAMPLDARYQRQAKAAVNAASAAIRIHFPNAYSPEAAVVEAIGRVAAALILAEGGRES